MRATRTAAGHLSFEANMQVQRFAVLVSSNTQLTERDVMNAVADALAARQTGPVEFAVGVQSQPDLSLSEAEGSTLTVGLWEE